MNKKINTVLFVLGATLFNIIVALICLLLLMVLYAKSPLSGMVSDSGQSWAGVLIFISSIAVSMFVYRIVLKALLKKVDVEKYFDPLFVKHNLKKTGS